MPSDTEALLDRALARIAAENVRIEGQAIPAETFTAMADRIEAGLNKRLNDPFLRTFHPLTASEIEYRRGKIARNRKLAVEAAAPAKAA